MLAIAGLLATVRDANDQGSGEFNRTLSSLSTRSFHIATKLANGRVLVASGTDGAFAHTTAETYGLATSDCTDTGEMAQL